MFDLSLEMLRVVEDAALDDATVHDHERELRRAVVERVPLGRCRGSRFVDRDDQRRVADDPGLPVDQVRQLLEGLLALPALGSISFTSNRCRISTSE